MGIFEVSMIWLLFVAVVAFAVLAAKVANYLLNILDAAERHLNGE